ncbi:beta-1,4 N-acetylgalactosaminyltransferase 2-like [Pygocentrus nattereri]|uniref:Glycosyltransferase 2-like domain-containing protein n=1 Tax=Pygocentrus nattereri TaxID=42514 RepID=A0A3B4CIF5_PYGNA|nr:beta-1,4 N-acetylgalactosaminyltransferase 2-like [Pygocentrus nattereri]XP_037400424.1 beta-1,4 N-acetylgalactosaminyltransferase 2-like [Pygocentrus nattereri]XP_037400425.1 beta-1,4 N-acetylgalactosaminyltransferase 2-like [Pygocentrus nattereri]XP_037400426.1 beta-1,4 N-acetylgalactosaminyltransferase 2-like [Pygocentrus nattereri]XP_037400427.1 beta-1,4 N-acetylgalactosaminyltransferase 2-like [Pygocentrus nattereri]
MQCLLRALCTWIVIAIIVTIILFTLSDEKLFSVTSYPFKWIRNMDCSESFHLRNQSKRLLLSVNRSSCSCEGDHLSSKVPQESLGAVEKRRAEEYRQHQIRTAMNLNKIILALPNSPLQYPIHGLTVIPMKKSLIPGLALHADKRAKYKVSLSVQKGVLSVNNDLKRVQVDGQDQNTLTISSTCLDLINHLLSGVMYSSTVYHIRTSDMVSFSFEDYEAIFPITVRRPSVPVLYDPGEDINSLVTIAIKTFLRYAELKVLIKSIRRFYPDIKIIVADDSLNPENVSGTNIEHYIMPPAQGWFAGRNLAISQVTSKYFLWVDDDYVFNGKTRIESFVEVMEAVPELDVLGGDVDGNQFYFSLMYDVGDENEGGCMSRLFMKVHSPLPGFDGCYLVDGVVNFFLARTDAVRRVGFDPFLKRVAHTEFFIDGLGALMVATCKGFSVGHQKKRKMFPKYNKYRRLMNDEKGKLAHHFFKNHLKCIKY